jgi:Flp pilus assembly protein TadD
VAKSDPTNAELHEVLAQSCWWAKNYSCALDEFHKILQQTPDSPAAHMLSREALDGLGRTPEAIVEFQTAAKIAPTEPNVNFGLGYLRWKMRQYDDTKWEFEAELVVDPENPQALAYLGDIEMKTNDPDQALPLLKKAVQLKRRQSDRLLRLGSYFSRAETISGRDDRAATGRGIGSCSARRSFPAGTSPGQGEHAPRPRRNSPKFANFTKKKMRT